MTGLRPRRSSSTFSLIAVLMRPMSRAATVMPNSVTAKPSSRTPQPLSLTNVPPSITRSIACHVDSTKLSSVWPPKVLLAAVMTMATTTITTSTAPPSHTITGSVPRDMALSKR
jgi:hypothetical protein